MPPRAIHLLRYFVALLCTAHGFADVPTPPSSIPERDSLAVRMEEGAELTRWLGAFRLNESIGAKTRLASRFNWITGLTHSRSTKDRIRHDVRWSNSASRLVAKNVSLWAGLAGHHYVDQLRKSSSAGQDNTSHIIRGGVGPAVQWTPYLRSAHSLGGMQEARDDLSDEGVATWHSGEFVLDDLRNHHKGALHLDLERPGGRSGNEAGLSYGLSQSFDAAAHSVDVAMDWKRRDLVAIASLPSQLREEKALRFADNLTYEISRGATLRGTGDVRYADTRIDDRRGSASRLEEIESGLQTALALERSRYAATLSAGLRNTSQNVRGEILSGQKIELDARGETTIANSDVSLASQFTKYTLDTRSDDNYDDRDELGWRFEMNSRTQIRPDLVSDVQALVDLNHLVYIFAKNSANNRWTRLFLVRSRFTHRASQNVTHVPEFRISANYQDYDFETNPRQVRSTVYRRLSLGDSVAIEIGDRWSVTLSGDYSREELGRLYWAEFEEERSDQTDVTSVAFSCGRYFAPKTLAALGFAYNRRAGDRFEQGTGAQRVIDLVSSGPTARLEFASRAWFAQASGQWVMQTELGREDRSYFSGSLMAGRAW